MPVFLRLKQLRQEDLEFKANLCSTTRPCFKTKPKNTNNKNPNPISPCPFTGVTWLVVYQCCIPLPAQYPPPHPASSSEHLAEQTPTILIKPVLLDHGAMWTALGALILEPIAWQSQKGSPRAQRPGPAACKSPLFLGLTTQTPHRSLPPHEQETSTLHVKLSMKL